jgi:dihydrolipoamide dehydrogenase
MVGAACEHLAHLVAWAVETGMTVTEALRMPYYHPVYEEAIQDALYDLDRHLNGTGSSMVQFERLDPVAPAPAHGPGFLAPLHSARAWGQRVFLGR